MNEKAADNAGQSTPASQNNEADPGIDDHIEICPRCGQTFDTRILHQVIYHDQANHKPIDRNT